MAPIEISSPHSYSTSIIYTHYKLILNRWRCRETEMQTTAADRRSDRNMPPMLWYRRPNKTGRLTTVAVAIAKAATHSVLLKTNKIPREEGPFISVGQCTLWVFHNNPDFQAAVSQTTLSRYTTNLWKNKAIS